MTAQLLLTVQTEKTEAATHSRFSSGDFTLATRAETLPINAIVLAQDKFFAPAVELRGIFARRADNLSKFCYGQLMNECGGGSFYQKQSFIFDDISHPREDGLIEQQVADFAVGILFNGV